MSPTPRRVCVCRLAVIARVLSVCAECWLVGCAWAIAIVYIGSRGDVLAAVFIGSVYVAGVL